MNVILNYKKKEFEMNCLSQGVIALFVGFFVYLLVDKLLHLPLFK